MKRKRAHIAVALVGGGLMACQWLVGIGPVEERAPAPGDDAGVDAEATEAAAPPRDAAIVCRLGFAVCDGTCVAIGSDPKHCGACGHDCLGAECLASECVPGLVAADSTGGGVYVRGNEIFYEATRTRDGATESRLVAKNLTTGAVRDLVDLGLYFTMFALPGTQWLVTDNRGAARVRVVDGATGEMVRTLYSGPFTPNVRNAIAIGDDVYFTTRGNVQHVKVTGGPSVVVRDIDGVEGGGATSTVHASGTAVYFGIESEPGLHELPRAGGTSRLVDRATRPRVFPAYIETRPGFVRWLGGGSGSSPGGELRDVPLDGGAVESRTLPLVVPHGPVASGTKLYVADDDFQEKDESRVVRIDLDTAEVVVLVSRSAPFGQLAADDRYVYMPRYANYGGGVFRVAR